MNNFADLLVLGNVITMDDHKPFARAVAAKGDKILYVGSEEVARKLCDEHTKVCDFGSNSVYPGFLESHCHPGGAGQKMTGQASLPADATMEECVGIMKKYMEDHPDKKVFTGLGFVVKDSAPCAAMLDSICLDKVMVCSSEDGHSMWLNTRAMEAYGIDQACVEKWGTSCVRVDENGRPTGYISEGPAFAVRSQLPVTVEDMKEALLAWQDFALANGYTGVYNAGVELVSRNEPLALYELEKEGKLKHYIFSGSLVADNTDTPEEDIEKIAREAKEHNSKHYKILGAKVFCDGVVEAHTAWLLDDYGDQPGYKGVSRFNDHDKMVRLLKAASSHGFNVHVHSIGDASTKAWVDAIAEAEEATGNFDMRNALAHLQVVRKEDIQRFADYNICAVAGIMWMAKAPVYFEREIEYLGEYKATHSYPVKSFLDKGAVVVSHTDYPVSPLFYAPWAVCLAAFGYMPSGGKESLRNPAEVISRKDALKTVTTNVAYMWHEEDRMGSLEVGKLANMAVYDTDFLKDDMEQLEKARCLATFVDGELLYQA